MRYRALGSSGLTVSVVGLGCNAFGSRIDEQQTRAVVDAAIDRGITLFDTADTYGLGASEELLGKALGPRRDDVVVATKFGMDMQGHNGPEWEARSSRRYVRRAVEASLRRLGTDHIDLYQVHRPDPSTDIDDTLSALSDLVRQGKVRYLGSSTFPPDAIVEAQWVAEKRGRERFVCEQPQYSLFARSAEEAVLPACERHGMGVICWSPLAGGWLTGKYRRDQQAPAGSRAVATAASESSQPSTSAPPARSASAQASPERARPNTATRLPSKHLAGNMALPELQGGQTDQRQHHRDDPEADDDRRLLPALLLEMVVQRRHGEHPLAGELVGDHLHHHRDGLEHEQSADDGEHDLVLGRDRDGAERAPQRQRARVSHEDHGGRRIEPQEAEPGAQDGAAQDGQFPGAAHVVDLQVVGEAHTLLLHAMAESVEQVVHLRTDDRLRNVQIDGVDELADRKLAEPVGERLGLHLDELLAKLASGPELAALNLARSRATMEGELKAAEARVEITRKKWERADELHKRSFVSANAKDEAEAEYRLAQEQARAVREGRKLAELEVKRAEEVLGQRSIHSPVNGVVVALLLNPGELASSNQKDPILRLMEIDPLNVELVLPLNAIPVRRGAPRVAPGPLSDEQRELRKMLEWEVGLRVFYWGLPSPVAGMYGYATDLGGCILINRKHPPERRRMSMLQDCCDRSLGLLDMDGVTALVRKELLAVSR